MRILFLAFMLLAPELWAGTPKPDRNSSLADPWTVVLVHLGKSILALTKSELTMAQENALQALTMAERNGLERLATWALCICGAFEKHRELQWINHFRGLPASFRNRIQEVLKPLLPRDVFVNTWVVTSDSQDISLSSSEETHADLIINQSLGRIDYMGKALPLVAQSLLFKLAIQIALAQSEGMDKADITQRVWGYKYDPTAHDAMVYMNIRRLRKLIPVELYQGRYRLSKMVKWKCITNSALDIDLKEKVLSERQLSIVDIIRKSKQKNISRKEVVTALRVSPRTVLRDLTSLVELDILSRKGFGRGAIYSLNGKGV